MIKDLPTGDDFRQLAKDCLIQASNNLFQVAHDYTILRDEGYEDLEEELVWKYHTGDLRTCLVLVFQAFELYLKAEVCAVSPFLLLDSPKIDWPTNPESGDKSFNDLFTIAGEQLLRTFNAVSKRTTADKILIYQSYNDIRVKRNRITHSASALELTPGYIVKITVESFTLFEGKDQWWRIVKNNIVKDPIANFGDGDYLLSGLTLRLAFIESKTSIKFLNKHSEVNLLARRYFCPACIPELQDTGTPVTENLKWAFLFPNKPGAKEIWCYNCERFFKIHRSACEISEAACLGDVFSESGTCLTCLSN